MESFTVSLSRILLPLTRLNTAISPNSTANQAYQKALETGILLASIQTFTEYESVISRPKFDRYISLSRRQNFLAELRAGVELIEIIEFITDCRDTKDNIYLDVAINGLADVLITGDQDLLVLHAYRGILPILNPSDFIKNEAFTR